MRLFIFKLLNTIRGVEHKQHSKTEIENEELNALSFWDITTPKRIQ